MPTRIAAILSPSDPAVRGHYERTYQAMWRDLARLQRLEHRELSAVTAAGWSIERVQVIAVLNAFSRTVLGPLAACFGRNGGHALGHTTTVAYAGQWRVNDVTAAPYRKMLDEFARLSAACNVREPWLHASRVDDLLFAIARAEQPEDTGGSES
jgi:hypothetical protein